MKTTTMTALLLSGTLVLSSPGAALAQDDTADVTDAGGRDRAAVVDHHRPERPSDFDEAKRVLIAGIERRLSHLRHLSGVVSSADHVTDAHAADLQGQIDRAGAALTDLLAQAEAAETTEQLRAIAAQVKGHGVYLVLTAKVHVVIGADTVEAAVAHFGRVAGELQAAIERARADGHDVAAAQGHLDAMTAHVDRAAAAVAGVADRCLAAASDEARSILEAGRQAVRVGHGHLREAREEAGKAIRALHAAIGGGGENA